MIYATDLLPVFAQIDMLRGCCCGNCLYRPWTHCQRGRKPYGDDDYCFDWKARLDSPQEAA